MAVLDQEEEEPTNMTYMQELTRFWRVLMPIKKRKLVLFAEMKLPEAWLEFKIINTLYQSATFRPRGIWGKLYWYSVLPFHGFIFNGMNKLIE
jgi:hypothetical protein